MQILSKVKKQAGAMNSVNYHYDCLSFTILHLVKRFLPSRCSQPDLKSATCLCNTRLSWTLSTSFCLIVWGEDDKRFEETDTDLQFLQIYHS